MPARKMTAFQILAEPVRVYLVELLCTGAMTSGDLAQMVLDRFGVSWGAVSRHLATMRASGFVRLFVSGQERWYSLDENWLKLVRKPVVDLLRLWEQGENDRRLGYAGSEDGEGLRYEWKLDPVQGRRGLRGRTTLRQADRGRGRSEEAFDADGGLGFD